MLPNMTFNADGSIKAVNNFMTITSARATSGPSALDCASVSACYRGARLCAAPPSLCAEHVRQLGGESPLLNLMEVKS